VGASGGGNSHEEQQQFEENDRLAEREFSSCLLVGSRNSGFVILFPFIMAQALQFYWDTANNAWIVPRMSTWSRRTLLSIAFTSLCVIVSLAVYTITVTTTFGMDPILWTLVALLCVLILLASAVCLYELRHDCLCCYPFKDEVRAYMEQPPDSKEWLTLVYTHPYKARYLSVTCDDDGASWSRVPSEAEYVAIAFNLTLVSKEPDLDHFIRVCQHVPESASA